jgi:hypothetical protein
LNWLGTSRRPTMLHRFCVVMLVMRVAGVPLSSIVKAPVMWRACCMKVCEIMPPSAPG